MKPRSFIARLTEALRGNIQTALDVAGFSLLSTAAGMWEIPVGVAVAGVSCLLLSWRS